MPILASMPCIIGTSGYSYLDWVGPVYPQGSKREDFLKLYAAMFPTVELNFSYYKMPQREQLANMSREAPDLLFSIKGNESLTHTIDLATWRESAATFISAAEALARRDRLGAVLLQFPSSFHYEPDRRRYLDELLRELQAFPLATEFRAPQWANDRVIEGLRARGVAWVATDQPDIPGLPPTIDAVTSRLAYIRCHGRVPEATWWNTSLAMQRYNYLYSEAELKTIKSRVEVAAGKADRVLVYFNNHPHGQAAKNAQSLHDLFLQS